MAGVRPIPPATFSPLAVTKSMPRSSRKPGSSSSTAIRPGLPIRSPIIRTRQAPGGRGASPLAGLPRRVRPIGCLVRVSHALDTTGAMRPLRDREVHAVSSAPRRVPSSDGARCHLARCVWPLDGPRATASERCSRLIPASAPRLHGHGVLASVVIGFARRSPARVEVRRDCLGSHRRPAPRPPELATRPPRTRGSPCRSSSPRSWPRGAARSASSSPCRRAHPPMRPPSTPASGSETPTASSSARARWRRSPRMRPATSSPTSPEDLVLATDDADDVEAAGMTASRRGGSFLLDLSAMRQGSTHRERHLAYSTARVSRMTVTLIWPG